MINNFLAIRRVMFSSDIASVVKLRNTYLGRFYVNYIKQFSIIKKVVVWIWSWAYPVYIKYTSNPIKEKNFRKLVSLTEHVLINNLEVFQFINNNYTNTVSENYELIITQLQDAIVYGCSNLILLGNDLAIVHNSQSNKDIYIGSEWNSLIYSIDQKFQRIKWSSKDKNPEFISKALIFSEYNLNYAYWIAEVLPKVISFCKTSCFDAVPIIISDNLSKNILESLLLAVEGKREILICQKDKAISINILYVLFIKDNISFFQNKIDGKNFHALSKKYNLSANHIMQHTQLKKYIQRIKNWFYPLNPKYKLTPLNKYIKKNILQTYQLMDGVIIKAFCPPTFPRVDQKYLLPSKQKYYFPEICVTQLKKATIYGGTNFVLSSEKNIIYHDLYDLKKDYTSEELHKRISIDTNGKYARWLFYDNEPKYFSKAAIFLDACAINYAHWLTEVLPRIALFCSDYRFMAIPIVINDGLHENIIESLFRVVDVEREIITCPLNRAIIVEELYITSPTGYVPFQRRTTTRLEHSHGEFSSKALEFMRNKINIQFTNDVTQTYPDKIFLRRNSSSRNIDNVFELEMFLVSQGYVIIETEKLSFTHQIQLFKNANIIIAPTGAALANAIFCKPGTQVMVLMAKHKNMIYRYWCNILCPIKIAVTYILCDMVSNENLDSPDIHGNYIVNIKEVLNALKKIEHIVQADAEESMYASLGH